MSWDSMNADAILKACTVCRREFYFTDHGATICAQCGPGMELRMTRDEAKLLIAILLFAEGAAPVLNPPLVAAIADLRPLRSALLQTFLRHELDAAAKAAREATA